MSVHFVLSSLESTVNLDVSGSVQTSAIPALVADASAVLYVSVDTLKDVFKFQTDSTDFTDLAATDIKYYTYKSAFPDLNPVNAMMDAAESRNPIAAADSNGSLPANKMMVAHDFVRYLAYKLFGSHYGVDLFNNEVELMKHLRTLANSASSGHTWYDIQTKVAAVDVSGSHADLAGTAGSKYMTNANSTSDNLCRVLFEQMTKTAISRFSGISPTDGIQSLPFLADDSISFKLTINPAAGQNNLTGVSSFGGRSYDIRLILKDGTPSNTAADTLETA